MKKVLGILGVALFTVAMARQTYAQTWTENFNSLTSPGQVPAGWLMINDGYTPSFNYYPFSTFNVNAWIPLHTTANPGNNYMTTVSSFNPVAKADRWLISKSFTVSSNAMLTWNDLGTRDSIEILISPTAGTTAASFVSLYRTHAGVGFYAAHTIPIGAYASQTVRVAFRNATTNGDFLFLDDVSVFTVPGTDGAPANILPIQDDLGANVTAGAVVPFTGSVKNVGYNNISFYNLKYQFNGGPVQTQAISANIASYNTGGAFNFSITAPSATGRYPVRIWIEVAGDANHSNDTFHSAITVHSNTGLPHKKLVIEEATGTWCSWCVRGIVYMDSMQKQHLGEMSLIAVHVQSNDPMAIPAYYSFVGDFPNLPGEPGIIIDRREANDVSQIFNIYNAQKNNYAYAEVTMANPTYNGSTISVPVTVTPASNMIGDYRLALILTESRVHNTGAGWDQANGYSGGTTPMQNTEYNFVTLPNIVPAAQMYYNHVARVIAPNITGAPNSLPNIMIAGQSYRYTLTATVASTWNRAKINGIVALIAQSNGNILNSVTGSWTLSVNNLKAGINNLTLYPNPATSMAIAKVELSEPDILGIDVIDMTGRTIYHGTPVMMPAGSSDITLPIANLVSGIYNIRVQTGKGVATEHLSVLR